MRSEATVLDKLRELARNSYYDYHSYFRTRGIALKEKYLAGTFEKEEALRVPDELMPQPVLARFFDRHFPQIKKYFLDILLTPESAQILWALYCSPGHEARSLLGDIAPSLDAISDEIRAGPNTYKLNGWMVHVLVGYGMTTSYIPRGELPPTAEWMDDVRAFCRQELKSRYWGLRDGGRLVLHVAMLGHDIGVRKAIADHDVHGAPMVPDYLRELGIDHEALMRLRCATHLEDLTWAVQAVVRHHTLVNRIGVEFSLHRSAREFSDLTRDSSCSIWRKDFLQEIFAPTLLIVGTSDLVAVDDALLSGRKAAEIQRGYKLLTTLLHGRAIARDPVEDGIERFRAFLSDRNDCDFSLPKMEQFLRSFGYSPQNFWMRLSHVGELNFALSLLRYLPSALDTLYAFLLIIRILDDHLGVDPHQFEEVRVVFDPELQAEHLSGVIDELKKQEMRSLTEGRKHWEPAQIAATLKSRFSRTDQGYEIYISAGP